MKQIKIINILVDNDSWILPYAFELLKWCQEMKLDAILCRDQSELRTADVSFFLGCTKIVDENSLSKSKHNLVVHESNLPEGKGFAPMAWQMLEGKKCIPICLIEAVKSADSGDIWLKDKIVLTGGELHDEWRLMQGKKSIDMCQFFIKSYETLSSEPQVGNETTYARRTPKDSVLDINKTIKEQFNLLRIVDNNNYPAFFIHENRKYKLEITAYEE